MKSRLDYQPNKKVRNSLALIGVCSEAELAEPVLSEAEGLKQSSPNLRSWLRSSAPTKAGLSFSQDEATRETRKEEVSPTPTRWRPIVMG